MRGRYALPQVGEALRAANALTGVLSHSRAALHRSDLGADEVVDSVTSRERTLVDCLRCLPFDQALAVGDSALRAGGVTPAGLGRLAAERRGRGAAGARRVAPQADGRAANPFESVLRGVALDVPRLLLVPQAALSFPGCFARPDLVDLDRRLGVEADSFAFHAGRQDLRRDCRRYTELTPRGFVVLRFGWEGVMGEPAVVRTTLERAEALTGTGQSFRAASTTSLASACTCARWSWPRNDSA